MVLRNEDGSFARTVDEIAAAKERQEQESEPDPEPDFGGGGDDNDGGGESSDSSGSDQDYSDQELRSELEEVAQGGGRAARQAGEALTDIKQNNYNEQLALDDKERLQNELSDRGINDGIGNVVASGDPSEGEDVVSRGSGDTMTEARTDAAANPNVDFDSDTPTGRRERELGTNQPLSNIQGSQPEAVQERLKDIAGSNQFQGNRTGRQAGAIAQAIQRGQDEFDSVDIQTDQGQVQVIGRRERRLRKNNENADTESGRPFPEYTDIGTLVNPTKGNPNATLAEELTTAGVDLMQQGQNFADSVGEKIPTEQDVREFALEKALNISQDVGIGTKQERQEFAEKAESFIGEIPNAAQPSSLERGVARTSDIIDFGADRVNNEEFAGAVLQTDPTNITKEDLERINNVETNDATLEDFIDVTTISEDEGQSARKNVITGTATGGSQVAGLAISSTGAIPRASATTTQNILGIPEEERKIAQSSDTGLAEGAGQGVILTSKEVVESSDEFVGQEVGEEIGEAVVFGGLTGGAGLTVSAVPTPEIEPTVTSTSKGATRGIPGVPSDTGPGTTPGPGATPGPTTEPEPEPETDTETLAETNLQSEFLGNARTTAPSLEDVASVPESTSQPQSDVLSRPESDIIGETETKAEPQTESQPEPDIISEAIPQTETEPEPVFEPETPLEPDLQRTPSGDLPDEESDDNGNEGLLAEIFGNQQDFKFQRSVAADLLNLEGEGKTSELSAGNPFNLRTGNN